MTDKKEKVKGCDLKKQSQFSGGQNGVNSFLKGNYGNKPPCGARKNKANSKPNKANLTFLEVFYKA